MQTSKKILITVGGVLLAMFISSLMILRSNVLERNKSIGLEYQLTKVPVDKFRFLHFSGNWEVQVKQGRSLKVEVTFDEQNRYMPQLLNNNDTLYFSIQGDSTLSVRAKVITPNLTSIAAFQGAKIRLLNFELDTMFIELHDSHLTGEENKIIYTSYKTTGNSGVEFIDDPFK